MKIKKMPSGGYYLVDKPRFQLTFSWGNWTFGYWTALFWTKSRKKRLRHHGIELGPLAVKFYF